MIILDWTRPWSFMEQLQLWLTWIELWGKGDGSRDVEIARDESRERRAFYHYHYHYYSYNFISFSPIAHTALYRTVHRRRNPVARKLHPFGHRASPSTRGSYA